MMMLQLMITAVKLNTSAALVHGYTLVCVTPQSIPPLTTALEAFAVRIH